MPAWTWNCESSSYSFESSKRYPPLMSFFLTPLTDEMSTDPCPFVGVNTPVFTQLKFSENCPLSVTPIAASCAAIVASLSAALPTVSAASSQS